MTTSCHPNCVIFAFCRVQSAFTLDDTRLICDFKAVTSGDWVGKRKGRPAPVSVWGRSLQGKGVNQTKCTSVKQITLASSVIWLLSFVFPTLTYSHMYMVVVGAAHEARNQGTTLAEVELEEVAPSPTAEMVLMEPMQHTPPSQVLDVYISFRCC
jgi:hypothetical protein